MIAGSPQWQQYLFIAASFFLLWELWRGWKLGAVRGLLRLTALFCAWIGGTAAAGATGTFLAFFSSVSPLLAPAVAAVTVGVAIYLGVSFLSGLLFKRTDDHVGVIRVGFGFFGAIFGVIFGLLMLWGGISLIRGLGALGEMRLVQAQREGRSAATESTALFLVKLKASLELGVTGEQLKNADPLPTRFYDNIVKISMVAGNQQSLERFFKYPATLELIKIPRMLSLVQDPALQKAVDSKNILPLIQSRQFQAAFQDPEILAKLKDFNLSEALDFALEPDPPQIQMQHGKLRRRVSPPSPPATNQATTAPLLTPIATPTAP
jgi:hypothetical protein